jgi:hypothetical protein
VAELAEKRLENMRKYAKKRGMHEAGKMCFADVKPYAARV